MSELTVLFCDHCHYSVPIGWVGKECNRTIVICTKCTRSFYICPADGEQLYHSNQPYQLVIRGKQWEAVSSKKGRIKKQVLRETWIDSGIQIPVHEDVILVEERLRMVYEFIFDQVPCPNCHAQGTLAEYQQYYLSCPSCKIGQMR
ncbi:hypothetical protein ACN4EG_26255 [Alkalinema pantanalense CENA528]|uniref:hypothetical protein n=1 Tax=Alkalinema pantanalense TaxID=1620705 RepID=UPI003D6FB624